MILDEGNLRRPTILLRGCGYCLIGPIENAHAGTADKKKRGHEWPRHELRFFYWQVGNFNEARRVLQAKLPVAV